MIILCAIHVFATLCMVGIIWFVQVVHYPLMAFVGVQESAAYAAMNQRVTTWVVGPFMLLEAGSTMALAFQPLPAEAAGAFWLGVVLLVGVWLSTAALSVPQHGVLSQGFSPVAHRWLVRTNWIRTIGWTIRGMIALYVAWQVIVTGVTQLAS